MDGDYNDPDNPFEKLEYRWSRMSKEEADVERAQCALANKRSHRVRNLGTHCITIDADPESEVLLAENNLLKARIQQLESEKGGGNG